MVARIQNRAFTKTVVFVPYVPDGHACFAPQAVNQLSRFLRRAVVGNHQLEIAVGFARQIPKWIFPARLAGCTC